MPFSNYSDCLLATSMNGVDIPADHGYPLRAFFPAVAGARSVKWVTRLSVLPNESEFPWNRLYYKEDVDGKKASIVGLPLQSLVLSPEDGTTVPRLKTVRTEVRQLRHNVLGPLFSSFGVCSFFFFFGEFFSSIAPACAA